MYKWFTLQFPSVETLYGLCQENMNIEHKRGRGWNNIRLSPGWHGDRAHSRSGAHWTAWAAYHCHGPIPLSSLEVGQGWYWRASSVTTVGIKRNRIMGFPSGEMLQPTLKVMWSPDFSIIALWQWQPYQLRLRVCRNLPSSTMLHPGPRCTPSRELHDLSHFRVHGLCLHLVPCLATIHSSSEIQPRRHMFSNVLHTPLQITQLESFSPWKPVHGCLYNSDESGNPRLYRYGR